MKSRLTVFILAAFIFIAFSCDRNMVFDKFNHIPQSSWGWNNPVGFEFEFTDTVNYYNILIQLRHTTDYPLSNLYMFVNVDGPSDRTMRDTINFELAEPDGKWIGKGNGKIREIGYLYKRQTRFPEIGVYHFSIEQAMRLQEVPVSDIGLRIEKVSP